MLVLTPGLVRPDRSERYELQAQLFANLTPRGLVSFLPVWIETASGKVSVAMVDVLNEQKVMFEEHSDFDTVPSRSSDEPVDALHFVNEDEQTRRESRARVLAVIAQNVFYSKTEHPPAAAEREPPVEGNGVVDQTDVSSFPIMSKRDALLKNRIDVGVKRRRGPSRRKMKDLVCRQLLAEDHHRLWS